MPNTPPSLIDFPGSVTFAENAVNAAPALIDANVDFRDLDNNYTRGTLTVSGLLAEDRIAIRDQGFGAGQIGLFGSNLTYGGVAIGTFTGGVGTTLTVSFNSSATSAAVDALIQNLTYANVSDTPTARRTLYLDIADAAGAGFVQTADFANRTGAANPFNGVDVGVAAAPAAFDYDQDGDLDLVVGAGTGGLSLYRNDGGIFTAVAPGANPFRDVSLAVTSGNLAPSFTDLDSDGDLDLVVGGANGALQVFRNAGGVFTQSTGAANPFNGLGTGSNSAPGFIDLDGDGDEDLLRGTSSGVIQTFRNDGGVFSELAGAANPFASVHGGTNSRASFFDIDNDGDLDVLVGSGSASGVQTFRNNGDGTFGEVNGALDPFDNVTLGTAAAAAFLDVDGDGDLDGIVGNADGTLRMIANTTLPGRALTINVTPESDVPALTGLASSVTFAENAINAAPALLDADVSFAGGSNGYAGGKLIVSGLLAEDRVAVRNQGTGAGQIGVAGSSISYGGTVIGSLSGGTGVMLTIAFNSAASGAAIDALIQNLTYANASNTPTPSRTLTINVIDSAGGQALPAPDFVEVTGAANPFNGIAIGYAAPQFADLDGDGDLDIAIGRQGLVRTFRNDGDAYVELTGSANPFGGIGNLIFNATLSFYDRDGDGDLDAVVGRDDFGITLLSLRNDGGVFIPVDAADDPFRSLVFDRAVAPAMVDLDGDGDVDLAVGLLDDGAMQYFRNDGGSYVEQIGAANPFAAVGVGGYATPTFGDLDGDGDLDLVVGAFNNVTKTYRNDGGTFVELLGAANPLNGAIPTIAVDYIRRPTFVDADGDGDLDLVVGQVSGPLRFIRNDAAPSPTVKVNVTAEVEGPTLSGLTSSLTFAENAVNAAPALLDADVSFGAGAAAMAGGTLTVSGLLAEDRVAVRNQGTGAGQIGASGTSVSYGGTVIGTIAGGAGTTLTITLNASTSAAAVDALIQNLTYANVSDTPTPSRTLSLDVVDSAGLHLNGGAQAIAVTVTPEVEGPRIAGLATALTFGENAVNAAPALIDGDVTFTNEAGNLTGGTLTVSGLLAEDRVAIGNQGQAAGQIGLFGANVTYGGVAIGTFTGGVGSNLVVTLNSSASTAAVDALIQNLTYADVSDTPTASRMLGIEVVGGQGMSSGVQSIAVTVTAEGDVPTLTGLVSSVTFGENAVNIAPALLDVDVTFAAGSAGFGGGTLIVSGLLAEDRVSVQNQGTGAGQIGISGTSVSYGGTEIGTLSGGAGTTLTITFNTTATGAAVDALIEHLTYANVSNTPTASRTLHLSVFDSDGRTFPGGGGFPEAIGAANPFDGLPASYLSAPSFVDVDGDGDLDAVVGNQAGQLELYINSGGGFSRRSGSANPFSAIDVGFHARPSFVDLDGDGDRDMVVGAQGGTLASFRNNGGVFTALTGAANPFNGVTLGSGTSPSFVDLDGDGDLDAVVGDVTGTLASFRNVGGVFTRLVGAANPFNGADVGGYAAPSFGDIDGDGDLDAVVGAVDGTLHTFRNTSGAFTELTGAANPFNCVDVGTGAAVSLVDLDGDGDVDAVVGESEGVLHTFINPINAAPAITINVTAESEVPALTGLAPSVTFDENPVNATPALLDADVSFTAGSAGFAGGRLIVSGLLAEDRVGVQNQGGGVGQIGVSGSSVSYGGIVIGTIAGGVGATLTVSLNAAATTAAVDALIEHLTYANTSDTPTASRTLYINLTDHAGVTMSGPGSLTAVTGAADPFNGVDVGSLSSPAFVDLDADGALDLVVGNNDGLLRAFHNTGGVFTELTGAANPFGSFNFGGVARPSFGDIDGDGDLDAVVGNFFGTLTVLRNDGGIFTPLSGAANPFNGIDFGTDSAAAIVDLDGDGDQDAVVGSAAGTVRSFGNDGGVFTELTGVANPFRGLGTTVEGLPGVEVIIQADTIPAFVDLNGDGDLDAVIGLSDGTVLAFSNANGEFRALTGTANPFNGVDTVSFASPAFADVDGDGDVDAVLGGFSGALLTFLNTAAPGKAITVNVTAQNQVPTLTGLAPSVTFAENAVNEAPALLDTDVSFVAGAAAVAGGALIVSGLLAEDRVGVENQGTGAGQIGVSGVTISYGGVVIGTLAGGSGTTLTVALSANATAAAVDALIQNLTYANGSDTPTASRTLHVSVLDSAGVTLAGTASFAEALDAANPFPDSNGQFSSAAFGDFDGDGDQDAVVGYQTGRLFSFRNDGGVFTPLTGAANPFNGLDVGNYSAPSFADFDGDGDADMVVGTGTGTLRAFRNTGGVFTEMTGAANPFNGVDVGDTAAPAFVDFDGDGDLDAVVGALDGTLQAFRNAGGVFTQLTGTANPFNGIDVGAFSTPSFADLNGDGVRDLLVGADGGLLRAFYNTNGSFTELTGTANPFAGIDMGTSSAPSFGDVDGDGDLDAVIGGNDGSLRTFINTTPPPAAGITVTVTPEAEGPRIAGLTTAVSFAENAVNAAPALIDGDVIFTDEMGNLTGGTLTVSGLLAEDRVAIRNQGFGAGQIGLFGGNLTYAGVAFGTYSGGSGGNLQVTFNSAATAAAVDALIQNLTYADASDSPTATRTLGIEVVGGQGIRSGVQSVTVTVTAEGDAAALTGLGPSVTFAENAVNVTPALLDADVAFVASAAGYGGGRLVVSGVLAEDRLGVQNEGNGASQIGVSGTTVSYGGTVIGTISGGAGAALTISLTASASEAAVEALIENLTYANVSNTPTASRTLYVNVFDAAGANLGGLAGFAEATGAANPFNGADVEFLPSPTFLDLDNDGDLDAVVGSYAIRIQVYRNDGGVFSRTADNTTLNFASSVDKSWAPAAVDLDGDGDLDLAIGFEAGNLRSFRNDAGVFVALSGTANPFNGIDVGYDASPGFVDLDGDGDFDAVIGERSGTLLTFRNDGGSFVALTGASNPFNGIDIGDYAKPSFVDIDGDGDRDMVVGTDIGTLRAFRNDDGVFTELTGAANPFNGIDVGNNAAPTFVDLDNDGDPDAVVGEMTETLSTFLNTPLGTAITVNVTPESDRVVLTGLASSVTFAENSVNAAPALLDSDVSFGAGTVGFGGGKLSVSGLLAEDRVGVQNEGTGPGQIGVSGTSVSYGGTMIGTLAGGVGGALTISLNASATAVAVDALIEHLTYANVSDTPTASRTLYVNVFDAAGANLSAPASFTAATGAANPFNGVDLGILISAPTFLDLDNDGDLDAAVATTNAPIRLYRNDGGVFSPMSGAAYAFGSITDSVMTPSAVDLDGDGDLDLVLGLASGTLRSFRNDSGVFVELSGAANPFDGIDVGDIASPGFVDLDGDGDFDAVIGEPTGTLLTFRNDGGRFIALTGASNPFNGIDFGGYLKPSFVDIDGDGDRDMVLGTGEGTLRTFRNDDGVFTELTGAANPFDGIDVGQNAAPAFVDLDKDGDPDAVLGRLDATLSTYLNTASPGAAITVNVTSQGDLPSLVGLAASVTFAENTVNAAPALIDADVVFDAGSAGLGGGGLSITGLVAGEDRIGVRASGLLTVSGSNISYDGTLIGTIGRGSSTTFGVTFTAAATAEAIDVLLQNLTYANSSDAPTASRTLTLSVTDALGAGLSGGSQSIVVDVAPENDAPTLTGLAASVTFAENAVNAAPALIDGDVVFGDAEGNLAGGTLTVSGLLAEDRVGIRAEGLGAGQITTFGANLIYDGTAVGTFTGGVGGTLTVTFNSAITAAAVDALLQNLTFANVSNFPTANRTLTLTVTDAAGASLAPAAQVTVTVTAQDDLAITGADSATTAENATVVIAVLANDSDIDGVPVIAAIGGTAAVVGTPIILASGAKVTLNADGTISYDPNGQFNALVSTATAAATGATNTQAIDIFGYTLADGTTASVSVTVTGVTSSGDHIVGDGSNNNLIGTAGTDVFMLQEGGSDNASGGAGDDAFYFGAAFDANDTVSGGETAGDNDQVGLQGDYTGSNALTLSGANLTGIETVALLAGFDYTVTALDDLLQTGQTITFFGGGLGVGDNLTFNGAAETSGRFLVYGGLGTDLLTGGGGNDGFQFAAGRFNTATDVINGGGGTDQVALNAFSGTISGANLISVETVVLLSGSNAIVIADDWTLAGQSRTIFGSGLTQGATIDGSAETNGNLALYGGSGNDVLTGGARKDMILGGAGNDTIRGGLGADYLRGDGGADTFVYGSAAESTGTTRDTLVGFDASVDKIDLPNTITAIDTAITVGSLSNGSFDSDLTAALAGLGANHAITFTANQGDLAGRIFLIADTNGVAGYQAGQDAVFELVNPTLPIIDPTPFV